MSTHSLWHWRQWQISIPQQGFFEYLPQIKLVIAGNHTGPGAKFSRRTCNAAEDIPRDRSAVAVERVTQDLRNREDSDYARDEADTLQPGEPANPLQLMAQITNLIFIKNRGREAAACALVGT